MNVHFKNIEQFYPSIRERKTAVAILVFKTNLRQKRDILRVTPVLNGSAGIIRWNVDKDDIDKVLRIETDCLQPQDIISLITDAGYFCEELPD